LPNFGIISEGITDRLVLMNILTGYYGRDVLVTPVQPPADESDEDPSPGGWGLVFKSLEAGRHRQAIEHMGCDYVVIHLDTDVSQQKGYDVPWREEGRDLSVEELIARVVNKLENLIGAEFYAQHSERFVFAVAVHAIECWLLPLHYDDNHASKITGCLDAVNRALQKSRRSLTRGRDGEGKDPHAYRRASRDFANKKRLLQVHDKNPSLALFVRRLQVIASPEAGA
jgi:hypothetical protein